MVPSASRARKQALLFGASCLFAAAQGPAIVEHPPPASTFNRGEDVLLVRLGPDHDATYSEATVERVFRGREKPGSILIRWILVAPAEGAAPKPGDRLIVVGHPSANIFFATAAFRDSEPTRRDFAEHLPAGPRADAIQLTCMLVLLATPVAQVILYRMSKRDRRYLNINLAVPVLAAAVYIFYETGIPRYMNIRVDLLILIPLAALTALLWVLLAVRPWNRDARRPAPH